jgi:hypothetical protein
LVLKKIQTENYFLLWVVFTQKKAFKVTIFNSFADGFPTANSGFRQSFSGQRYQLSRPDSVEKIPNCLIGHIDWNQT